MIPLKYGHPLSFPEFRKPNMQKEARWELQPRFACTARASEMHALNHKLAIVAPLYHEHQSL